ncbi:MAG: DUF3618 domain-containing protein [Pseudonocardiaceae bacterium]
MSISSRERIGPASDRTAQPVQPAKTPSGKPPASIHQGSTHTREQLSETVKALAGKVDLPLRVKDKVQETRETAQAKIDEARQYLHKGTETLQDKATEAKSLSNQALAKVPAPVVGRIAVAAVLLGVLMVLRRLLRRNQ